MNTGSYVLLIVNLPPELEEGFIDWLLEQDNLSSFISQEVRGHSENHEQYSQAEKVRGNKRMIQFQIAVPSDSLHKVEQGLKTTYGATPLFYWVVPAIDQQP